MYESFSRVYRQMALNMGLGSGKNLSFFEVQRRALCTTVIRNRGLGVTSRILDAAAGTGDVLCLLHGEGYHNVEGIDGSQAMLDHWPQLGHSIPHKRWDWTNIKKFFKKKGHFDLVFFMGHSLPHLPIADLSGVLTAVFNGLNPGGVIAFDLRTWRQRMGVLVQPGRRTGHVRYLQTVDLDSMRCKVYERVEYTRNPAVQHVYYEGRQRGNGQPMLFPDHLAYSIYTVSESTKMLEEVGFSDVTVQMAEDWKYQIVHAVKPKDQ